MEGKSPALERIISEQSSESFIREKTKFVLRMMLISALVIFALETLNMVLIEFVWAIPHPYDTYIDGISLVLVLFPLIYYFITRPISREIDKHYQTNQELLKSYELLERFFSVSDVMIAFMDADFNFIRVNQAYADADQRDPSFFVGKNHFALYPNDENRAIFETVIKTGRAYNVSEKPFQYATNPERGITYWDWNLLPVKDSRGRVAQLLFVLNDVTSRKKAQIALSESERRLRAVFNQTFEHMALLDPAGNIMLLNQTALEFSGLSNTEVTGKPFWQLSWWITPVDPNENPDVSLQTAVGQAARQEVIRGERQVKSRSGEPATVDFTFKPLVDDKGSTSLIIYEARDISERIRAEQALRQREKENHRLYQAEMQAHVRADVLRHAVQALSGSLNSRNVLEILLDNLNKVVPFSSAHTLLEDGDGQLVVLSARGEENWEEPARLLNRRFEIDDYPLFKKALVNHEILCIADTWYDSDDAFFQDVPLVLSWLAIPLQAGDQVAGLCILEHECPGFFTDEMVQWALTLTSQAAAAIQNASLFEQVRDNREQLQALSRRLVTAQENERRYIARELHDDAGQALTSLMLGLRHMESDCGDPAAVLEHIKELKQLTDGVMENIHRLSVNLRPATLDHLGLVPALRQNAETMSAQHGLAIQFEVIGNIGRLPGEMESAIYRIVQESLTNIARHARASRVDILLESLNGSLIVVVEDDGIGFDPQAPVINRLGLLGMRERADMLGGTITVESAPGKGSTIVLEVPCPSEF